jgi:hypothetical protein
MAGMLGGLTAACAAGGLEMEKTGPSPDSNFDFAELDKHNSADAVRAQWRCVRRACVLLRPAGPAPPPQRALRRRAAAAELLRHELRAVLSSSLQVPKRSARNL